MKIGIVLGSIRDHRKGESVARWVLDNYPAREGVDFEIIDVSGFDLPLLSDETLPAMRGGSYDDPRVQSFADRIAGSRRRRARRRSSPNWSTSSCRSRRSSPPEPSRPMPRCHRWRGILLILVPDPRRVGGQACEAR